MKEGNLGTNLLPCTVQRKNKFFSGFKKNPELYKREDIASERTRQTCIQNIIQWQTCPAGVRAACTKNYSSETKFLLPEAPQRTAHSLTQEKKQKKPKRALGDRLVSTEDFWIGQSFFSNFHQAGMWRMMPKLLGEHFSESNAELRIVPNRWCEARLLTPQSQQLFFLQRL